MPDDHPDRAQHPQNDVWGNEIEYVYVVYRPAENSALGREEILGVHKGKDRAESHNQIASSEGDCEIVKMRVHPEESALDVE